MRTLLDENVPAELARCFEQLAAIHIEDSGRKGAKNGELLAISRSEFELLITFDKGLRYQHSHFGQVLRILILRLPDNKAETVLKYAAEIERRALNMEDGEIGDFSP